MEPRLLIRCRDYVTDWTAKKSRIHPCREMFLFSKASRRVLGPTQPFLMDTGGSFPRSGRGCCMRLTTHHHLGSALRRSGGIHRIAQKCGFTECSSIVHKNTYTFTITQRLNVNVASFRRPPFN